MVVQAPGKKVENRREKSGFHTGDKSSPLLFGLVFNALLLALKATGVGHLTISGLKAPARGVADDLALVARSEADMTCLLQVVARFCEWSGMRVNYREYHKIRSNSVRFRDG